MTVIVQEVRRVDELVDGDLWWSPAKRWESVTSVVRVGDSYLVQVSTDLTGADYAWVLPGADKAAIVPADERLVARVLVVSGSTLLTATLTTGTRALLYTRDEVNLVQAMPVRGTGWQVRSRPTGRDVELTNCSSKATAWTAVKRAAKAHAKALGVELVVIDK